MFPVVLHRMMHGESPPYTHTPPGMLGVNWYAEGYLNMYGNLIGLVVFDMALWDKKFDQYTLLFKVCCLQLVIIHQ